MKSAEKNLRGERNSREKKSQKSMTLDFSINGALQRDSGTGTLSLSLYLSLSHRHTQRLAMSQAFMAEENAQAEEHCPPQYLGSLLVTSSCSLLGNKRAGTNEGSLVMMKSFCLFITMLMGLALCLFGGRRSMRGLLPWIQGIASAMLLVTAILSYLE